MSRRRARDNSTTASIFPFLAVLLSTMGVLVVLLVVMASLQLERANQQQSNREEADSAARDAQLPQLRQQLEEALAQQRRVDAVRSLQQSNLRREQLRISRIEENIRRWQDRLDQLRLSVAELQNLDSLHTSDEQQARDRLDDLRRKIEAAKQAVEQLTAAREKRPPAYAILPYDGPNGTRRRPIYIECRSDRIVIQPSGIELFPSDFHPELGAGNPLAAALRAAREYYVYSQRQVDEEPYPLILVRPDGVGSYREVLSAIDAWDSPFGYEMVGRDWKLDFGAADPALTLEMATAVDNARARQQSLAAAAPAAFAAGNPNTFEPSPSLFEIVKSGAVRGGGNLPGGGSAAVLGNHAGGSDEEATLMTNRVAAAVQHVAEGYQDGPYEAAASSTRQVDQNSIFGATGEGQGDGKGAGTGQAPRQIPNAHEPPEHAALAGSPTTPSATPPGSSTGAGSQSVASAARADEAREPHSQAPPLDGSSENQLEPAGGPSAFSGGNSSADRGVPTHTPSRPGLAVERPIQVVVRSDRLVVLEDGQRPLSSTSAHQRGRTIRFENNARQFAQQFSTAVRAHVEDWGIAGEGAYWKQVLVLHVAPGGERLADELAAALRASGVEVRLPDTARR